MNDTRFDGVKIKVDFTINQHLVKIEDSDIQETPIPTQTPEYRIGDETHWERHFVKPELRDFPEEPTSPAYNNEDYKYENSYRNYSIPIKNISTKVMNMKMKIPKQSLLRQQNKHSIPIHQRKYKPKASFESSFEPPFNLEDNVISVSESHKQRYQRSTQFQSETSQVLSHPPPLSNSHIQLPPPPPLQYLKQQKQNSQKDEIILTPPPNRSIQRPSPTQKSPQNLSHQVYQNQQQAAQLNPPPLPPPPSSPHQQSRKPPPPSILSTELFQHYQRKRQEFIYPSPQNTKQLAKSQPRHMMEGAHNGYFDDSQPLLPQQKQQQLYTYKSKPHYQPLP